MMQKNHVSITLPEVEPSNIVEDLYQKFNDADNEGKIKLVHLLPIDRSNGETTVAGLRKIGICFHICYHYVLNFLKVAI